MHLARSIVLVGFMGAGKSSVGRGLQKTTGWPRFDTDELVSASAGLPIAEIFSRCGEDRFRRMETDVLQKLPTEGRSIIVTGGGVVLRSENVDLLKRAGIIVWLDGTEEVLFARATRRPNRPLLQTADPRTTFSALLQQRSGLYAKAADIRIDTSELTSNQVIDSVLFEIGRLTNPP